MGPQSDTSEDIQIITTYSDLKHKSRKMYDPTSGIEVYIRPYGTDDQYTEYEAPRGSPLYTGNLRERYIEAITDERFEMVVILRPEFSFKGKTHACIEYDIDKGTIVMEEYIEWLDKEHGRPITDVASHVTTRWKGDWKNVGFTFGEVCRSKFCGASPVEQKGADFDR